MKASAHSGSTDLVLMGSIIPIETNKLPSKMNKALFYLKRTEKDDSKICHQLKRKHFI